MTVTTTVMMTEWILGVPVDARMMKRRLPFQQRKPTALHLLHLSILRLQEPQVYTMILFHSECIFDELFLSVQTESVIKQCTVCSKPFRTYVPDTDCVMPDGASFFYSYPQDECPACDENCWGWQWNTDLFPQFADHWNTSWYKHQITRYHVRSLCSYHMILSFHEGLHQSQYFAKCDHAIFVRKLCNITMTIVNGMDTKCNQWVPSWSLYNHGVMITSS